MEPERVLVGEVVGVFGVKGELKLRSFTDPVTAISKYRPWRVERQGARLEVDRPRARAHGKGLVISLPGVDSREAAEAWVGAAISVEKSCLPELPPGQYYWADLEGLSVQTVEGVDLGTVSHVFATGANDVLAVSGERERLIPFLQPDVIREVDLAARRIVVDWDPGF